MDKEPHKYTPTHEDVYGISWECYMARTKFAEKVEEYRILNEQLKTLAEADITGKNTVIIKEITHKQKKITEYLDRLKDIINAG